MILRMRTDSNMELKLVELQEAFQVTSKAAIMRIAIAVSLTREGDPRLNNGSIQEYTPKVLDGIDYHRLTIFGMDENVYKILMQQHLHKSLTDEEFFPELTFYHLKRGLYDLYADYKLAKTRDRLLMQYMK